MWNKMQEQKTGFMLVLWVNGFLTFKIWAILCWPKGSVDPNLHNKLRHYSLDL